MGGGLGGTQKAKGLRGANGRLQHRHGDAECGVGRWLIT